MAPDTLVNLSAALFIAPFFLLSATAGQLADKLETGAGRLRQRATNTQKLDNAISTPRFVPANIVVIQSGKFNGDPP